MVKKLRGGFDGFKGAVTAVKDKSLESLRDDLDRD
jgi:hypothetical protein